VIALPLPIVPERPKGDRPRVFDRATLMGTLFALLTGISWAMLPREMGRGSGVTFRRRLRDWHMANVRDGLHQAGRID